MGSLRLGGQRRALGSERANGARVAMSPGGHRGVPPAPPPGEPAPQGAAAPSSAGAPPPGTLIAGRYQVERTLGAGGMGVVVAALNRNTRQRVAIKFLRGGAMPDAIERFFREAQAAGALKSEHATRVYDAARLDSGEPYMVMEHLEGTDLGELLRRHGRLPVPSAVGFVLQACEAVAEAHARGIVHRDLKPSNLFVTTRVDGSSLVKVLDFGISKAHGGDGAPESQELTATGAIMGTPAYMSPEQIGRTKDADARNDIWSLGVILYELLTGVSPFLGATPPETLVNVVTRVVQPIRNVRGDVPEALAIAIDGCMARDLAKRIQSVGDLTNKLLPFAPSEAALAARIDRISPSTRGSTLTAPDGAGMVVSPRPHRRWGGAVIAWAAVATATLAMMAAVAAWAFHSPKLAEAGPLTAPAPAPLASVPVDRGPPATISAPPPGPGAVTPSAAVATGAAVTPSANAGASPISTGPVPVVAAATASGAPKAVPRDSDHPRVTAPAVLPAAKAAARAATSTAGGGALTIDTAWPN